MSVRGRFITLEGGEGVGKSTQVKRLAEALRSHGLTVIETREPGGSAGAEAIRELLMTGASDRWSARSEALLFAAARADHVAKTIRPAIESGQWVLCDRFLDSSRAYQGGADGLNDDDLLTLHEIGSEGVLPDRTLLLALPGDTGNERALARDGATNDRFGARSAAYHAQVAAAFQRFAEGEPERFRQIDASGSPEQVTQRLIDAIGDLLPC
ncbi:MAG: dTMP kinase [Sphingomonadaceae bacterium]